MANSLVFDNVTFSYGKDNPVFKQLSFSVERGSFFSVIGDNGSGKSTLAKLICGLLKPQSGTIKTSGYAGLVFQNPQNQMVGLTVEEEVAFGPENIGLPPLNIKSGVESALLTVGLKGLENQLVENLSAGQVQALAIAGILAMDSDIIVCDESLSMLDCKSRINILNILHGLCKNGKTVVYITNDLEEIDQSDAVLELEC